MASHEDNDHQAAAAAVPDNVFHPHDTLDETAKTAVVGLGAGLFVAAIQNAMSRRNVGAFGVFSRGAPLVGLAGMYSAWICWSIGRWTSTGRAERHAPAVSESRLIGPTERRTGSIEGLLTY